MVNIKDVAAEVGVSAKTVSRVVNGESAVKPQTRKRIEEAIEKLGYVPNQAARLVRTNRSRVLGILTDFVSTTPYSVEIIRGIQDRIAETDHSLLIANTAGDPAMERRIWQTFREHRIDGVFYATMYHRHVAFDFDHPPLPMILVNCSSPDHPELPSVVPDDYEGGYEAARYAIEQGHRAIAYITLNPLILAAELRDAAFRAALSDHHVPPQEKWIRPGIVGEIGKEEVVAFAEALALLGGKAKKKPTAIVCGNDEIALQVLCAALSLGLRIPQDVAIIGYDDFHVISMLVEPKLTTVALPYYEMGRRAGDNMMAVLSGADMISRVEKIPCPLVKRASA
ncbi:LacI family transcriptional regulator [Sphingomonas oleivorans]|uniref:LacI family transcriptional regulator n=1 Tax=Sphingomonas oleivorans TaxID=1735121 RepID=A0A2T5FVI9_9SPHN|nr:LacI family DNA-binding transcriptional regulator [Sphingomonas oleivorans]PTQ09794.1 LacI family transcriptional regulator [Sphingomonas oleivorans]